jgi:hypothetical protein
MIRLGPLMGPQINFSLDHWEKSDIDDFLINLERYVCRTPFLATHVLMKAASLQFVVFLYLYIRFHF